MLKQKGQEQFHVPVLFNRYHREFWLDFHFWLLVLLLVAVAMTTQDPLSVVSLAYFAFVGILILLQVFQPQVSNRQHPASSR